MAKKEKKKNVRRFYWLDKAFIRVVLWTVAPILMKKLNVHVERYKPKNDTFIVIGNHSDIFDPGFQMIAFNRYIRFVSADFLVRMNFITKLLLGKLDGVIVKNRDKPSSVLIDEILENLKAGIPVGLHAEGIVTTNGETGYISPNTGKLVKDSGVALITFRTIGGYLRQPRWAETLRTGEIHSKVVHEYSPEELANYTAEEINDIINRDIYVNAFEQQRMHPHTYKGKNLAESCERTLYLCPKCLGVSTMHSKDDKVTCECGYSLTYGEDCFFHGDDVVFDNVLDWDKWQRKKWKEILTTSEGLINSEGGQIINKIHDGITEELCRDGIINIYPDRYELVIGEEKIQFNLKTAKRVQNSSRQKLALVDENCTYYLVDSVIPRSSDKYVAAWYYLTGRDYK